MGDRLLLRSRSRSGAGQNRQALARGTRQIGFCCRRCCLERGHGAPAHAKEHSGHFQYGLLKRQRLTAESGADRRLRPRSGIPLQCNCGDGRLEAAVDRNITYRNLSRRITMKPDKTTERLATPAREASQGESQAECRHLPPIIVFKKATWRAKAARPAGLALMVVRGRRPTKALLTST